MQYTHVDRRGGCLDRWNAHAKRWDNKIFRRKRERRQEVLAGTCY